VTAAGFRPAAVGWGLMMNSVCGRSDAARGRNLPAVS